MDLNTQTIVWLVAEIGALNWGLVELLDINIVTEILPAAADGGTGLAGIAYIVIGLAGALALADKTDFVDLTDL